MTLPVTGSRLLAEDASKYIADMKRASNATVAFGKDSKAASVGANALSVGIGNILSAGVLKVADGLFQVGKAGVSAFAGSIKGAADLEAQMSGVQAVLGGTEADLAQLKQLTVDLGIDPTLKVSSVEAAEAIEMLAKNGLDMQTIMDGAAKATVALSNATGGEFARSADIMTDAAAIFKFEGSEMIDVVAGITAVTQSSKFSLDDYALALANGGDVAAKAGVPFDEFNTTIAAISPSFSSGMTAGTSFKNFLLRLVPNTDSARDAMRDLNLVTQDGKSIFFDAQGNLRDMADIAGILQTALGGLSEEQKQQALRTIFGNDAMGAALALADVGRDRFLELGDAIAQVDPQAAAATRMDNFAGAMEILDGIIESVSLQVGDKFLPALTTLARVTADFIDQNADKFVSFFERGAELVEIFAGEIEAGATPLNAFRTMLSTVVDQKTLNQWDSYVNTATNVIATLRDLAVWASRNGPTIISVIKGIGTGLLVFKTITTVAAAVTAFSAAWAAGTAVFTAAGGGLAGLVALMGGPIVVTAAAAALAIGGLVIVISELDRMYDDFNAEIDKNFSRLRAQSRATGDYTTEAAKLANTLELTTSGFGRLTFQADDTRSQLETLIAETGNFDGSLTDLETSLNEVFGGGVAVNGQYITLNDTFVTTTSKVRELAAANETGLQRQLDHANAADRLAEAQAGQADETNAVTTAINEAREMAGLLEDGTIDLTSATEDQIAALFAEQEALIAEAEAQRIAAEEAEIAAEIRKNVHQVITDSITQQGDLIANLVTATQELKTAEEDLAASPWDSDLIAKAQGARDNVSAAFDAIKESHRQMVLDIFIQQAQLEGGFNQSAANIAVSLGLMTQEEANLRLEAVRVTEEIGNLSDQMLQTFLADGAVSRSEAELLAASVRAIEDGTANAQTILSGFASGALQEMQSAVGDAGTAVDIVVGQLNADLPEAAQTSASSIRSAYEDPDWHGLGVNISGGVAGGINEGSGSIAAAAVTAAQNALNAAMGTLGIQSPSTVAADMIGLPFSQGIAVGIVDGVGLITDAIDEVFSFGQSDLSAGLSSWASTLEDGLDEIFGIAGPFTSLGNTAVNQLKSRVIEPLEDEISGIDENIADLLSGPLRAAMERFGAADLNELKRIAGSMPGSLTHNEIRALNQAVQLEQQRAGLAAEMADQQERILELQQAQADLKFLEQQLKVIELVESRGLSTDLLQGLEFGVGADPAAVVDAMTNVIRAIIEAAEDEAGIASPSKVFQVIGQEITAGLSMGIGDGLTAVTAEMANMVNGLGRAAVSPITPPATPAQTFSSQTNIDRSVSVQIENRSGGRPINDADQLAFIWGSFNV